MNSISDTPVHPWFWRSLPLRQQTGSAVFSALFQPDLAASALPIATLLESPYPLPPESISVAESSTDTSAQLTRYSICAGPPRWLNGQPQLWTPGIGHILPSLKQLLQRDSSPIDAPEFLPFTGGWLGWLGYDLAWEIEQLPHQNRDPLPFPIAYWYEPGNFAVLDHQSQTLWLAASESQQLDRLQHRWEACVANPVSPDRSPTSSVQGFKFWTDQADYQKMVQTAKQYIQAGDIFQTNLSLRFELETLADGWSIYRALQTINPSPFASYWHTPWGEVISCSPERLVQLQGHQAQTRPIAGTRPRGATPEADQAHWQDLTANRKENAEHIMLVDLERNDLGRVCDWGSVAVNELLTVERYSHVMHLVSNVIGTLRRDRDSIDLIQAVFPGGTITGCPKVRCMEIIEELEPVRRSLFYGSCGYLDWRGHLDLNILIRTLLMEAPRPPANPSAQPGWRRVWGQVGAGIVADSDPEREWHEALQKAKAQWAALQQNLT